MAGGVPLIFDLIAKDSASPTFSRVGDAAVLAATKVGKAQTALERSAIKMNAAGAKLSKTFTLPIVAAAAIAVDQAGKYQSALNTVAVATGQNAKQMAASSRGLENIAKSTGTSLEQLTTSLYTVEKSGLRGSKALDTVRAAAQGAKAEGADLGTATNALTSIMASYGKSLGSPVEAENALIRGAGLAKTSYQDFAGSLSNVVPLAARLGISFAQVAGAVDTMTQHGESASQATDNLNNLIRNLAGSNNVAVQAMGQLGLKSQDVAEKLSTKNGLSGALDMVENAMAKQTHGGMIVVSAFKNAQNATHDLGTELNSMPTSLQNISKQFASGHLSYQNYYSDVKGLGGAAFEMGKQFITTMATAKGFSNALKSGNPQVQTAAQAFKTLLGGATGMNAALMLSGQSAGRFANDTSAVAKAASTAGANVLGWSKTQATFNFKMDQAKEALQVLAVQAGSELLPVLEKIATAGTKATDWVGGLDHTQKEIAGWSLGVLAAAGPVLSLGSKLILVGSGISKFTVGATASFTKMAGATEEQSAVISAAAGRISTAIGAAGLGVAVGELTQNSSTATKSIGVLGSALAGAAIGAAGGPWGIAIGAAAGAVGDLATQWFNSGNAAKTSSAKSQQAARAAAAATQAEKQAVSGLLDQLQAVNGQYGKNYRNNVVQALQSDGTLGKGQAVGINANQVTNAALGSGKALAAIMTELYKKSPDLGLLSTQEQAFVKSLGNATGEAGKAEKAYELYREAQNKGIVPTKLLAGGIANLSKELDKHGTALTSDSNATIASSAYAARNTAVIKANVQQINSSVTQDLAHHKSIATVAQDYENQIAALQSSTTNLGFNQQGVANLITTYGKLPAKVVTYLEKQGVTPALIQAILDKYKAMPTSTRTEVNVAAGTALGVLGQVHSSVDSIPTTKTIEITTIHRALNTILSGVGHATGGHITGPGTSTSDSIPAMLSNGEYVINARAAAQNLGLLHAINSGVQRFAGGGHVQKSKSHYSYNGQTYDSYSAAHNAESRAIKDASYTIGGESYTSLKKAIGAISSAMEKAARDAAGLGKAADKGGSSLRSAFSELLDSAKTAGFDEAERHRLTMIDNRAAQEANRRLAAATKVANLRHARASEISTIRSAVTGGFQIATAGTGFNGSSAVTRSSIFAQDKQAALIAKKFSAGVIKLRKEGLALGIVEQLAQAGPSALAQVEALLQSTPKELRTLNGYAASESAAGGRLGRYVGGQQYNGAIAHEQKVAHTDAVALRREIAELRKDFREFSHRPEQIDIHIDGKKTQRELVKAERRNDRRK